MSLLLFIIIFIEGYVVLASELLAIRLVVPWVGTGTDVISIIIAAVLLPLAFGYHFGGRFQSVRKAKGLGFYSIRKKLLNNIVVASIILCVGLSYVFVELFFQMLYVSGLVDRLVQTFLYSVIFLLYPVFLLGQTIPLISHYFSSHKLSEMTGKMLFFSTVGSFMGSIFSTVVLMSMIGVHYTAVFIIALLGLLVFLLMKKGQYKYLVVSIVVFAVAFQANSQQQMEAMGVISNNGYNTIRVAEVKEHPEVKFLALNGNTSSSYKEGEGSVYNYAKYIHQHFIDPLLDEKQPPKDILVLGAAGFTLGLHDNHNNYTYVDIDPVLKNVTEKYFLKQKLGKNKKIEIVGARGFLTQAFETGKKFDLVILDTFSGGYSVPEHLVTKEYFEQVKSIMALGSIMVMNTLAGANFEGTYSRRIDNTLRAVFPHLTRASFVGIGDEGYSAWESTKQSRGLYATNVVYSYHYSPEGDEDTGIYTDDKNTYFLDK